MQKQKNVIQIPLQARFGNLLYFYLHCNKSKENNYILHTETMDYWLDFFPNLKRFIVLPEEFKENIDNIDWLPSYYQRFDIDFNQRELTFFIESFLLKNSVLEGIKTTDKTVINIRRGDFYGNDKKTPSSFDQVTYINNVIKRFPNLFSIPVEVVSDDINWCRENLVFPSEIDSNSITFKNNTSPVEDFILLCSAKNLIVTNSTFSYWAGYVCTNLSKDNKVIAPNFGSTVYENSLAHQLLPSWEIIDVLHLI